MSQLIMFQSGGFTNYGICYRKYSLDELKEIAMQEETKYHERIKTGRNGRTLRRNQLGFNKERKDCKKSFLNVQIMRKRRKKQLS